MTSSVRPAPARLAPLVAGVVLAVTAMVAAIAPVAADSSLGAGLRDRLQAVIVDARRTEPVPGISAAVVTPDDAWVGVAGRARFDPDVAVAPDTPFAIASVTKTFVAAAILQLREEGELSLSDRLSRWETRVPNASRITVRQLLSHTSGVRDMWLHPRYAQRVEGRPQHVWTYPEVRAMIGAPRFAPGKGHDYSNSNYVLLGRIIELETGHSVAREIRQRFLRPLGLDDTWFQGAEAGPGDAAMGYARRSGAWVRQGNGTGLRPTTSIATFFGASGAMASTARDVADWARALYGGRVLRPSSLAQMTAFSSHDYGLGTRRKQMGGREAWGHGGSLDGFETSMWYLPVIDSAVVVIWNRRDHESDGVANRLARRVVNALDPDTTPPTINAPRIYLRESVTVTSGRAPVEVAWSAARDSQGTIASYDLRRRSANGPWQVVRLASATARDVALSVPTDRTLVVAVRAVDDRGNASRWVESVLVVPRFIDEADPAVRVSSGWRSRSASDSLGGRVLSSLIPGSHVTFSFRAHAVAVVAPQARSGTRAAVRIDDRPTTTVDLRASSRRPRQSVLAHRWSGEAANHRVRIIVRDVTRPRVDIDGFLILEAPATP
jgi:D-alanyl-D-alanine carboxypeptidase